MRAAVVHAFNQPLVVEEVPTPTPGPEQVLVRIEASGLMQLPIFETVLGGLTLTGSIVGTHHEEVFALHWRGLTHVEHAERTLDDVNEAIAQVLDGSAESPRLVFRMPGDAREDTPAAQAAAVPSAV
jgi:propanol-preferring alcohol dehydrogenase